MKLSELSAETIEKIKKVRYDELIEKHEGPWDWEGCLKYYDPEFIRHEGYDLLLPIEGDRNELITIQRTYFDPVQEILTVFLEDATYSVRYGHSAPEPFLAVLYRLPEETFYLAIFYHSMYRIPLPPPKTGGLPSE